MYYIHTRGVYTVHVHTFCMTKYNAVVKNNFKTLQNNVSLRQTGGCLISQWQ